MPRIKRWFPVSHDFNADPEVWELTDKFGDRAIRVWLELLSIADRNDGELPGQWKDYPRLLAGRCRSTARHLQGICQWLSRWLAVDSEGIARVVNYGKYHRPKEQIKVPPDLPNLPDLPIPPKAPHKKVTASPDGFAEFWVLYPRKKSKGQAEKAWRSLNLTAELFTAIIAGVRRGKASRDWLKDNGKFIPYPATWLRAKGWEDQEINFSAPKPKLVVAEKKPTPEELERSREFLHDTIHSLANKMHAR